MGIIEKLTMNRNAYGFFTIVIMCLCYLVYTSKNETQSSYTVDVYNGLVQREMNAANLLDIEDSFQLVLEVLKNGLDETNDAGALADKYNKLKERIDIEIRELELSNETIVKNGDQLMTKTIGKSSCPSPPPSPVDVVYTWVNG